MDKTLILKHAEALKYFTHIHLAWRLGSGELWRVDGWTKSQNQWHFLPVSSHRSHLGRELRSLPWHWRLESRGPQFWHWFCDKHTIFEGSAYQQHLCYSVIGNRRLLHILCNHHSVDVNIEKLVAIRSEKERQFHFLFAPAPAAALLLLSGLELMKWNGPYLVLAITSCFVAAVSKQFYISQSNC